MSARALIQMAVAVSWLFLAASPLSAQDANEAQLREALSARIHAVRTSTSALEAAIKQGREQASFCQYCHGPDGNSAKPFIPNLAGQNPVYLLDQIEKFADGRRNDYIMSPQARQFTPEQKVALVVYFSSVTPRAINLDTASAAQTARGQALFSQICQYCHGPDGQGSEGYARLAGQHGEYVRNTLKHFRDHDGERTNPLMAQATRTLTDMDIEALAAYIATLR